MEYKKATYLKQVSLATCVQRTSNKGAHCYRKKQQAVAKRHPRRKGGTVVASWAMPSSRLWIFPDGFFDPSEGGGKIHGIETITSPLTAVATEEHAHQPYVMNVNGWVED